MISPGFYALCHECGSLTPLMAKGDQPECGPCLETDGMDPDCTVTVEVTPCPAEPGESCASEHHHYGVHMHVEEVPL